jgi:hypothetical protein
MSCSTCSTSFSRSSNALRFVASGRAWLARRSPVERTLQ